MHIRVEAHSGVPIGVQISRQLRLAIASGRVAPGDRLPSARELAARLKVNFHTVRKAYGDLERDGVLRLERGKGTFVADNAGTMQLADLRRLVRSHVERLAEDTAGIDVSRARLKELVNSEVSRIFRRRSVKR